MAFYLIDKEMANKLKLTAVGHVSPVEDFIFLVVHGKSIVCPWVYLKVFFVWVSIQTISEIKMNSIFCIMQLLIL